jgi:hypothetical protein
VWVPGGCSSPANETTKIRKGSDEDLEPGVGRQRRRSPSSLTRRKRDGESGRRATQERGHAVCVPGRGFRSVAELGPYWANAGPTAEVEAPKIFFSLSKDFDFFLKKLI